MSADKKIRGALAYRLEAGKTILLSKYDHAGQYETHGGAEPSTLYGGKDKSYAEAVAKVIENDPPGGLGDAGSIGGFKVVQSDQHQVVYGADSDGVCLAVITGLSYPSRVAIQMLQETYTDFMNKFGKDVKKAKSGSLSKKCKSLFSDACKKYDDLDNIDKAQAVMGKVDAVKTQMQSNISDMLKNTEKADSLAERSDQLNEQAAVFKKSSDTLRKQMAWKNMKMTLILGGVIVVILIIILAPLIKRSRD